MTDVKVRGVTIEVRSCKLTRSILNQFHIVRQIPMSLWDEENKKFKPECVVGWISGSCVKDIDEPRIALLTNGQGDYYLYPFYQRAHGGVEGVFPEQGFKQIYIS